MNIKVSIKRLLLVVLLSAVFVSTVSWIFYASKHPAPPELLIDGKSVQVQWAKIPRDRFRENDEKRTIHFYSCWGHQQNISTMTSFKGRSQCLFRMDVSSKLGYRQTNAKLDVERDPSGFQFVGLGFRHTNCISLCRLNWNENKEVLKVTVFYSIAGDYWVRSTELFFVFRNGRFVFDENATATEY